MGRPTFESAYYADTPSTTAAHTTVPVNHTLSPTSSLTSSPLLTTPPSATPSVAPRPTMLRDWYPNITSSPSHSAAGIPLHRLPATPVLSDSTVTALSTEQQRRRARIMRHYISAHRARDVDMNRTLTASTTGDVAHTATMPPPLLRSLSWTSSTSTLPNRVPHRPPHMFSFAYDTAPTMMGRRDALTVEDAPEPEEQPAHISVPTSQTMSEPSTALSSWSHSMQRSPSTSSGSSSSADSSWSLSTVDIFAGADSWESTTSSRSSAGPVASIASGLVLPAYDAGVDLAPSNREWSPLTWEAPIDGQNELSLQDRRPDLIRGAHMGSVNMLPVCPVCRCHREASAKTMNQSVEAATFWTMGKSQHT